ncbi:MAG: TnpV protein [Labrys sp. (in: a-proteobacteria)]
MAPDLKTRQLRARLMMDKPEETDERHEKMKARFAKSREHFLKESHPKQYRALKASGQLQEHCEQIGEEAADEVERLTGQMLSNPSAPKGETPESFLKRVEYFQSIPLVVKEIVMSEIVYAPPTP